MNKFEVANGAVQVKNSPDHTPRCIDVSTHLIGRTVETNARFWSAREEGDGRQAAIAYVSVSLRADELSFETPQSEADKFTPATEQTVFLDVEAARKLRDTLTLALDCADIK
jgi:hypothetical protein